MKADMPDSSSIMSNGYLSVIKLKPAEVEKLSGLIHDKLGKCGGFKAHDSLDEAKAVLSPDKKKVLAKQFAMDYTIDQQDDIHPLIEQVSESNIAGTIIKLTSFQTRFYRSKHGVASSLYIKDMWSELSKHRSDVVVEAIYHPGVPQPSIIMTVEGSENPEEIVILGGHADSITMEHGNEDKRSPGADDNASGIASVTEVIRLMMENNLKPKKTVQFMAYAAEEIGLVGSDHIAKSYKKEKKNVVGVMQLDMTLFKGTVDKDIVLIADETNKLQNSFVSKLIDEYVKVPWGYSMCGYGCSDHASWTDAGYASSFPFEANFDDYNQHIHTKDDTLESVGGNAHHSVKFSKLALAFVLEMAN